MSNKQTHLWKNDPAYQRWIGTVTRKSTKRSYRSWFRCYIQYTELTPSQLVDEAIEDLKRDPREKRDIVLQRLIGFYHWLKTDYQKIPKGKDKTKPTTKGVSDKVAHARVASARSFYTTFGVTVRMKGRHSLPRPRVINKRMIVNAQQVKTLINHARTPRDRAIILTNFQGGMDAETLCSIKYGDVSKGLENQEHPLKLELFRQKTGVEYFTFLGKDAVKAIKAYISDMESRDVKFTATMPLFLKERGKQKGGLTTNLIQNMIKIVAHNAGFVDGNNNGKAFNPLGPHALRESFGSIMINSGVPDTIVDFWLGHAIGEMGEAYKSVQFDSLKKMYLEREKLLSFSGSKVDAEEIAAKVKVEVEQQSRGLTTFVSGISLENQELKKKLTLFASENQKTKNRLEELEKKDNKTKDEIRNLSKTVDALLKKLEDLTEK